MLCQPVSFHQQLCERVSVVFFSRATAIEMVTALAQSQHGRQYLTQQGIMDKISNMIRGAETDPLSSLYLPGGYLFFYGGF